MGYRTSDELGNGVGIASRKAITWLAKNPGRSLWVISEYKTKTWIKFDDSASPQSRIFPAV